MFKSIELDLRKDTKNMTQGLSADRYIAQRLSPKSRYRAFPEAQYIINHQYKFIYNPIPKVASTSIKQAIIALTDIQKAALDNEYMHYYAANRLSLGIYHYEDAERFLQDSRYWKFVLIRNPWTRAISGYISKFVHPLTNQLPYFSQKVVEQIYNDLNLEPDWQKTITFRQFVKYLARTEDKRLDFHWKPQYLFLSQNYTFDFIGQFENLEQDFNYIQQKLGVKIELPWRNKEYEKVEVSRGAKEFFDYYPSELKQLPDMPLYRQFYNPELIDLVGERYAKDIAMFNYKFN